MRSDIRENLYYCQWECKTNKIEDGTFVHSHRQYRDTLKELYVRVLKFQASCVCYCSKNGLLQFGRDVVKWDKWDAMLDEIQTQDTVFCSVYDLMKDAREEEKFEATVKHHRETLDVMAFMSNHVAGLSQAIQEIRNDREREKLLEWLSSADPSKNFNAALDKHQPETGDWLMKGNEDFETWETAPNSLLWLNGKGNSNPACMRAY